jgi:transposase
VYIEKSKYRGSVRVRLVKKVNYGGKWYKELVQHIGTASHDLDVALLVEKAKTIKEELEHKDQTEIFKQNIPTSSVVRLGDYLLGAEVSLGRLFDHFNLENTGLLKTLVISRILWPVSKRRTATLIEKNLNCSCSEYQIYRYMDKLAATQELILSKTRKYIVESYPSAMGYVLYDVTTLYFETDHEDIDTDEQAGLRKKGYSKDHRHDLPQIVLGLAVNTLGMPLAYNLYSGGTYEGHTLMDGINKTLEVIGLKNITVVADAGMLSASNLEALEDKNLKYIVGARLKSLNHSKQDEILALDFTICSTYELSLGERRLIVNYSDKRANKTRKDREKSVARLKQLISKNTAVRKHKYLDFTVEDTPKLNEVAISEATKWDGIKGYITNTDLSPDNVMAHYYDLYKVEQSFRLSKHDIQIRPTFHYKRERIEAHIVICMLALTILRMLEIEVKPLGLTIGQAIDMLQDIKATEVRLGDSTYTIPPDIDNEHKKLLSVLGVE